MDELPYVGLAELARQLGVSRKVLLGQLRVLDRELHGMVLHQGSKHAPIRVNRAAAALIRDRLYRTLREEVTEIRADVQALRNEFSDLRARVA